MHREEAPRGEGREHLFLGFNTDETLMPDADRFQRMIRAAFDELQTAVGYETAPTRHAATAGFGASAGAPPQGQVMEERRGGVK